MSGVLYVVATPIGHLGDLSDRARETLAGVDLVAAEDTRHTGQLLTHFGIRRPLESLHEHSERQKLDRLVTRLAAGQSIALVSDAGTPLISDPGFLLVRAARRAGIAVVPVPGPSALTAALCVAGLPTDRFLFIGFLPSKAAARRESLDALADRGETLVCYESARRVEDCLADLIAAMGPDRPAFVAREMTKRHEQYRDGTLAELAAAVAAGDIAARGEFVLVIAGNPAPAGSGERAARELLRALVAELPASRAARVAARVTGVPRQRCYELISAAED